MAKRKNNTKSPAPKKQKVVQKTDLEIKTEFLIEALSNESYELPGSESNRELLVQVVEKALVIPVENRHEWQVRMAACVADAVQAIRSDLDSTVAQIQNLVDNAESMRANLVTKEQEAQTDLDAKTQSLEQAQEVAKEKADVVKTSKADLSAAEDLEQEKRDAAEQYVELKDVLAQAQQDFQNLRDCNVEAADMKNTVDGLLTVLNDMNLDESLLAAAPNALYKPVDKRGCFDGMSLEHIAEQFVIQRETNETDIAESGSRIEAEVANVALKQEAHDAALAAQTEAKQKVAECQEAKTSANSVLKAATRAISDHDKSVKSAEKDLVIAKEDVEVFQEVQDAHQWLVSYTEIVPEEPEVPVEEVAEPVEAENPAEATEETNVQSAEAEQEQMACEDNGSQEAIQQEKVEAFSMMEGVEEPQVFIELC
jgi:hypothetical protein